VASSISNSDQFPPIKHWFGVWGVVIVVVLCFATFVSKSRFSWFYDPTAGDLRFAAVQSQGVAPRADARIIIIGTSRAAFGLVPSTIERSLGRPPLDVANWSYPAFGLEFYERLVSANKDKVAAADVIVLGVDPYFALVPVGLPAEAATPAEPAAASGWKTLVDIVAQLGTRNWALEFDKALRASVARIAPVSEKMAWFLHELAGQLRLVTPYRLNWTMLPSGNWETGTGDFTVSNLDPGVQSVRIAENYYKDKQVSDEYIRSWRRFLQSLATATRQVVLVVLPVSRSFAAVEQAHADVIDRHRKAFQEIASESGIAWMEITAPDCGLTDHMFQDPVHVNRVGREALSECFAANLQHVLGNRAR
jgi:hypothetical protein